MKKEVPTWAFGLLKATWLPKPGFLTRISLSEATVQNWEHSRLIQPEIQVEIDSNRFDDEIVAIILKKI